MYIGDRRSGGSTCWRREITWVNEAHLELTKLGHVRRSSAAPPSFFSLSPDNENSVLFLAASMLLTHNLIHRFANVLFFSYLPRVCDDISSSLTRFSQSGTSGMYIRTGRRDLIHEKSESHLPGGWKLTFIPHNPLAPRCIRMMKRAKIFSNNTKTNKP